jgi:hypothetical protein
MHFSELRMLLIRFSFELSIFEKRFNVLPNEMAKMSAFSVAVYMIKKTLLNDHDEILARLRAVLP